MKNESVSEQEYLTKCTQMQMKIDDRTQALKTANERIEESNAEKEFLYRQVERGLFDKHTKEHNALNNMFYYPNAPWFDKAWEWDVSHKEYAAEFNKKVNPKKK